jgi:hypothetical protein
MLAVGVEAGGYAQLCMVCPSDRLEPHEALYVILYEWGDHRAGTHGGGVLRLCWEHLDELAILIAEVL